jgi:hypothetical protein
MRVQHTPQYEKPFCVGIVVNKSGITFCNVTPVKQCLWRLIVLKVEATMVSRREKVRTKVRMTATRRVRAKARIRVENVSPVGTTTATTKAEERHRKEKAKEIPRVQNSATIAVALGTTPRIACKWSEVLRLNQ